VAPERVLRALAGRGRPLLSGSAILRDLGLGREARGGLRPLLETLVREGRVERVGGRYRLPRGDGLVEGVFAPAPRPGEWGGAVTEEGGASWRVPGSTGAHPGDRVLLQPLGDPSRRRGEILQVVEGTRETWVGILRRRGGVGVLTPYRDDAPWRMRVTGRALGEARDGDVVVAVAAGRNRPRRGAPGRDPETRARVVEVLGPPGTPEADFRAVVWRRRLPVEFPAEALEQADAMPKALDPEELARRVDLRGRPFLSIDPATARDYDDAICVAEDSAGAARLWVAIADVSHYVAEGSPIDVEALRRGNSVYFPERAIPMLPERLSGDLCSLHPAADRLAMVAELEIDRSGQVTRRGFYPAVVRSRARLDYDTAARAMDGSAAPGARENEIESQLRLLARVSRRLAERRFAAGSIDFDLPSVEIVLGDDQRPVDIAEAPRTVAHRAVEEAMLAANRAVAEVLEASGAAALYRNHEPPAPGDAEALEDLLGALGLLARRRGGPISPREIARAVQKAAGRPEERLVNQVALRSMRQARYQADNRGHFALAFPHYTHFTSPIRRYADLVVHRALKALIDGRGGAAGRDARRLERMQSVAGRVSWRERVAMEAEREMIDLKKCAFMAPRVGEEFDGTVTGVARQGLYVTLDDYFVDGLVHVSTLLGYFEFQERAFALVARGSGERFRLGDRLRVRVDSVDRVQAHIDFSISDRLPRE
jgi:ribonuclease R